MTQTVAVAMSGGVDSSAAAARLVDEGVKVFGLMLRLWTLGDRHTNRCCTPDDVSRARQVAASLGIPFYLVDAQEAFKHAVVDTFRDGYAQGQTPNPCIQCNRTIRWGFLLDHARSLGATHLATGHYARVERQDGLSRLFRGVDRAKDQSYVLAALSQSQLSRTRLPIGVLTKKEVRAYALGRRLPAAQRPDSQDLCFTGDADYRQILPKLGSFRPAPGPIKTLDGEEIGTHSGLAHFTIGQRKGIGIAAAHPLYVVAKEMGTNTLVVGPRQALARSAFTAANANWVHGTPPSGPVEVSIHVRYHSRESNAIVNPLPDARIEVNLAQPLDDITPGQWAAYYQGDECLGGATIEP